jgi:hypothetical protein
VHGETLWLQGDDGHRDREGRAAAPTIAAKYCVLAMAAISSAISATCSTPASRPRRDVT